MKRTIIILMIMLCGINLLQFNAIAAKKKTNSKEQKENVQKYPRNFTFDDAMKFESLRFPTMSNDGAFFGFAGHQDRGDYCVRIYSTTDTNFKINIPNSRIVNFSNNSQWAYSMIQPTAMQNENKAKDKPAGALKLINLQTKEEFDAPNLMNANFSEDSRWLVYKIQPSEKPKMDNYKEKSLGSTLKIRHLESGSELSVDWVKDYQFDTLSNYLFYTIATPDGKKDGIYYRELKKDFAPEKKILSIENASFSNIAWNEKQKLVAFTFATLNKTGNSNDCGLIITSIDLKNVRAFVPTDTSLVPKELDSLEITAEGIINSWYIPEKNNLKWNNSITKELLYFGMKPVSERYEEPKDIKFTDSTFYNVDTLLAKAEVYIWGWNDPFIMTHQQTKWNKGKDRTYQTIYNAINNKFLQLADTIVPDVSISKNNNFSIAYSEIPYRQEQTWAGDFEDLYCVNLTDGNKIKLANRLAEAASISKSGNYIIFYQDKHWHLYDAQNNKTTNITQNVPTNFYDVKQDVPSAPYSNGFGGWLDDEKGFFLYDNWDIWYFEIQNNTSEAVSYRCFTGEKGKANDTKYTLRKIDTKADYFNSNDTLIITAFDNKNKNSGVFFASFAPDMMFERIPLDAHFFRDIKKVKDSNKIYFAKEKYNEFPNYYLTNYKFENPVRISDLNLNILDTFNWGHTELVEWKYQDTILQGYLVKPDNYDSTKSYPFMVYFYDQMSDRMNRFYMPELTHRPVNQIYMDNYIMFFTDIKYKVGSPGDDALNCILSGCRELAAKGILDTTRACIQGHSWGGYQTAYIAVKPTFFAAACAGAPVGNMTSAYSGIRLESGRARQMQYEAQQSRIGGSIFDSLDAYIRNSPIFFANQSNTPLLIGHGDIDEAVPYQQGVELYMAFRRAQKPAWLLQYVKEPHWVGRYWNKVDYSIKMKEFFDHYVLGKDEPAWMKGQPYKGENFD